MDLPLRLKIHLIAAAATLNRAAKGVGFKADSTPRKAYVIREYAARYKMRVFVETGTYVGDMAAAVVPIFDRVLSIELDTCLWAYARRRFQGTPSVTILCGDSTRILPSLLEDLQEAALFWLDAHPSGGITSGKAIPLAEELKLILADIRHDHLILADDFWPDRYQNGYPGLEEVGNLVRRFRPYWRTHASDGILRIVPPEFGSRTPAETCGKRLQVD